MRPLTLLTLLCFLAGTIWALTRSPRTVLQIQATYYRALHPLLTTGSSLEKYARNFTNEAEHSQLLTAKLDRQSQELERLRILESRLRELEQENANLRNALNFSKMTRFDVVAGNVVRRQPSNWWRTIEINRGQEVKIGPQLPVLNSDGLVGQIDSAQDGRSTVLLLTDEACQVAAKVEGSSEQGIVSGQRFTDGPPRLVIRYLSKETKIRQGQRIFSSGKGGLFPANILIGTVESVEHGSQDSEATIIPSVDFSDLETVFVVLNGKQP